MRIGSKTRAFYGALFGLAAVLSAHGQTVSLSPRGPSAPLVPSVHSVQSPPPVPHAQPRPQPSARPAGAPHEVVRPVPQAPHPNGAGSSPYPDAVSRELTAANGAGFGGGADAYPDAVSRELTVANGAGFVGGSDAYPDAVSRELTVANGAGFGAVSYPDAVSRELTVANGAGFGAGADAYLDAVSRELTVNNAPGQDTTPPDTTILTGPPPITCVNAPTFTFIGTDNITTVAHLKYQYRVDGGAWQAPISATTVTLQPLSDGPHLFEVSAIDEAGNVDPTPAQSQFVVDTAPPVISPPFAEGVNPTTVNLSWTSDKPTTTALVYRLQGDTTWTPGPSNGALTGTHSVQVTGLSPGRTYEAQASGADACGTVSTSTIQTFTLAKDTTPPTVLILSGPAGVLCSGPAVFTYTGSDDVTPTASLVYQYRVDGGTWQGPSSSTTATLSGLADGSHNFEVEAIDQAGNVSIPAAYLFSIDSRTLTVTGVQATNVTATTATIIWQTNKAATSQVDYRLTTDPNWTSLPEDTTPVMSHQVVLTGLQTNVSYAFRVHSIDNCATEIISPDGTFTTTDTTAPTTQITSGPAAGSTVCATPVTFTVTGTDPNFDTSLLTYEYSLDGAAFTAPSASTTITLTGLADGLHTIKIAAVDPAGLVDPSPPSVAFTVDTTPPVISAILATPLDHTATITWTTDKPTISQVDYGLTTTYGTSSAVDTTPVTSHIVTLSGLTPLTTYHFRIRSADMCQETDSGDQAFTTTIILLPNLSVTSLSYPATVSAHQNVAITWVVQNSGPGNTTTTWNDDVYLSPTPTLDPATATLLGKYSAVVPLAMGANYAQNQTITLPGLSSGSYYLIVIADGDDAVSETTKDDNALAMPITFRKVQAMIATPDVNALTLHTGIPVSASLTLTNLGDTPLVSITAAVTDAPGNVSVQVSQPDHVDANSSQAFTATVVAADASTVAGAAVITLTSASGQQSLVTLNLTVVPKTPNLVVSSGVLSNGALTAGMLRGDQRFVDFTITNTGDAVAKGLVPVLPNTAWLTLTTPASPKDLAPGATATYELALTPSISLPLGLYSGTIIVSGSNASLSIPYAFDCISGASGGLKVVAQDELSFFADTHPNIARAHIVVSDATTGTVVVDGLTGGDGTLTQTNVPEGNYNVDATADGHAPYHGTLHLLAGETNETDPFLYGQFVTYMWSVGPIPFTDQYGLTLNTTFSTNIPAPVVTADPGYLDLTTLTYDATGKAVVYYTLTNAGLIAANSLTVTLNSDAVYTLTTPVTNLGTLAALSSVVIPVTISRHGIIGHVKSRVLPRSPHTSGGSDTSGVSGNASYTYQCGGTKTGNAPLKFNTGEAESGGPTSTSNGPTSNNPPGMESGGQCHSAVTMRVDASRDGNITFDDGTDDTTADKPYTFWLNYNTDAEVGSEDEDMDPAPTFTQAGSPMGDSLLDTIPNTRDLEDYERLQIKLPSDFDATSGNWNITLQFTQVTGDPQIKVVPAPDSSLSYLTGSPDIDAIGIKIGPVSQNGEAYIDPNRLNIQNGVAPLLFEGLKEGAGTLTVRLYNAGQVVAKDEVYLNLLPITKMYDHYSADPSQQNEPGNPNNDSGDSNAVQPFDAAGYNMINEDQTKHDTNDYILFVHGWRLQHWERIAFAQTAFKRLWHLGYKGRFGFFSWPTEYTPVAYGLGFAYNHSNYDVSEQKAYNSAAALQRLLVMLSDSYSVRMFAHSQGNLVASEALRLESEISPSQTLVQTYAATHAAVSAHAYNSLTPTYSPTDILHPDIPDIYAHYPTPSDGPYFGNIKPAAAKLVNFFNPIDFAVGVPGLGLGVWLSDQLTKPDIADPLEPSYDYNVTTGNFEKQIFPFLFSFEPLNIISDRYEIFAKAAPAFSYALGGQSGVGGPFTDEVNLQSSPYNFTNATSDHSAEFQKSFGERYPYWKTLLDKFGISYTGPN